MVSITKAKDWKARDPNAVRLVNFLVGDGQYADVLIDYRQYSHDGTPIRMTVDDWDIYCVKTHQRAIRDPEELRDYQPVDNYAPRPHFEKHPVRQLAAGKFFDSLVEAFHKNSALTPGQSRGALNMLERCENRLKNSKALRVAKEENPDSEFVGTIGQHVDFTGKVINSYAKSDYQFVKILTVSGNVVTLATRHLKFYSFESGKHIAFSAIVSDHVIWNGVQTTRVHRPRNVREVEV